MMTGGFHLFRLSSFPSAPRVLLGLGPGGAPQRAIRPRKT